MQSEAKGRLQRVSYIVGPVTPGNDEEDVPFNNVECLWAPKIVGMEDIDDGHASPADICISLPPPLQYELLVHLLEIHPLSIGYCIYPVHSL